MVEDKPDILYSRRGLAGNLDGWEVVDIIDRHLPMEFNFEDYNFKINGVVYYVEPIEWNAIIHKLQTWQKLKHTKTDHEDFTENVARGFLYDDE